MKNNLPAAICLLLLFASLACGSTTPAAPTPISVTVPATGGTQLPITPGVAHVTESGFLKIPGSIENRTGDWIGLVIIEIKLYDKDNNLLAATSTTGESTQVALVENGILAPGETGYFMYIRDITKIEGEFHHFELSATAQPVPERGRSKLSGVKTGKTSETYIEISGDFTSSGEETCYQPVIVAVGYNSDGLVYEVSHSYPNMSEDEYFSKLDSGMTAPFQFYLDNEEHLVTKFEVLAGCNFNLE